MKLSKAKIQERSRLIGQLTGHLIAHLPKEGGIIHLANLGPLTEHMKAIAITAKAMGLVSFFSSGDGKAFVAVHEESLDNGSVSFSTPGSDGLGILQGDRGMCLAKALWI